MLNCIIKQKNIPVECEPSSCNQVGWVVGLGPGEQGPVEDITPCIVMFMLNSCLGESLYSGNKAEQ